MKKIVKETVVLLSLIMVLMLPFFVFADTNFDNPLSTLEQIASKGERAAFAEADENSLATIIGTAISAILSLLGVIFIILTILAGFKWMTANGNEEKITEAKQSLKSSIVGLVVILSAYTIWSFISGVLLK